MGRPVTIYSLTCGCTLLICGSISDVVGSRQTYLLGCFLQCAFTLACGLSQTGAQIIVFRAFSGIAASFSLPSAVSLINEVFPPGRSRNAAFATMGGSQPLGFGLGLTLGGVFTGTVGWQWGFYTAAITNLVMLVLSAWQLPRNVQGTSKDVWQRLVNDIDWIGAIVASIALAILSYVITYANPFARNGDSPLIIVQRYYWQSFRYATSCQYLSTDTGLCAFPSLRTLGWPTRAYWPSGTDPKFTVA